MEDKFAKAYKSLNKGQKAAVDAIEGPVMVVAGPGTGKTTVLTLRIANILKQTDTPAHGILAITYTDAGVKAMRKKLRDIIGSRAHEVEIHTFHSFAKAMMNEYQDHFVELGGLKQMTEVEAEMLVKEILEDKKFIDLRPSGKPDAYLAGILRSISDSKRDAVTPKEVREFAKAEIERIESDESSVSTRGKTKGKLKAEAQERIEKCKKTILFADIYELYEREKRERKRIDFNDLIIELLLKLKEDELFLRLLQERFLYILVDEHQDTNDAQNYIITILAEFFDTPNIFIVGDEKQAIYRFQGASVENFLKLRERWPDMLLISLETNYRSHQSILDGSFSVIEKNYLEGEHHDLRVRLTSGGNEVERPIELVSTEDVRTMEYYLVEELKKIVKEEPESSVAIITRRNRDLEKVIKILEFSGVPVSSERSVDIFHHPIGVIFFSLIEFVYDNASYESLAKTLSTGMWELDFDKSISLTRSLRAGKHEELTLIESKLREIRRLSLEAGAIEFVVRLAEVSNFADIVSRDPSYVHVWKGIISLAESLVRDGDIESPLVLLEQMLAYKESAETKTVKVSVGAPDLSIRALTAHGSKGLEFDYVFMPYATEEAWVGRNHGTSFVLPTKSTQDGDIRDVRRLFYVGLTRARKHVVVLTPLEESDGKTLTPLRFISEIESGATTVSVPRISVRTEAPKEVRELSNYDSKIIGLAKELVLKNGLSVTALNHFLECPNKFIYESVLKMPQAPSITATKGTAMHEALSHIWMSPDRLSLESTEIERIMREIAERSIDDSYLSKKEKDLIKHNLEEEIGIVVRELKEHLKESGTVYTEKWVESERQVVVGKESVFVPIHGKLDLVVDQGNELKIFDYKTTEAKSINEIKGETKDSLGNYFRQLVFYKILTEADPKWKLKKKSLYLAFIKPDKKERIAITNLEVEDNDKKQVLESLDSLVKSVWSGEILKSNCGKDDCEYCSLRTLLSE